MKRSTLVFIVSGVIAAHAAFFWFIADKPAPLTLRNVPPPNFRARSAEFADPETGDKMVYREFTVSTKLQGELPVTR